MDGRCIDGPDGCSGEVRPRAALSGTGRSFSRCDKHWDERLAKQDEILERYPTRPPADFNPLDAGEVW